MRDGQRPELNANRDWNRIPKILEQLKSLWSRYPDMRLGQLLENVVRNGLYFIEDENLMEELKNYYDKLERK